jgi:TonB family protein
MFEATLQAANPDQQRLQRLLFASMIALASTAAAFASVWTLEQMHIDRIAGPVQQFELAHLSLLPPPQLVDPPPPPPPIQSGGADNPSSDASPPDDEPVLDESDATEDLPDALREPPSKGPVGGGDIPDFRNPIGCPGGVCGGRNPNPPPGPLIKQPDPPPAEVQFSALRCLACADPDEAALRKTTASLRSRSGKVIVRFCVNVRGRVEADSIDIERSYGDAAVDRITRAAIEDWRFSPMKVGNQPRRACSRAEFNIRFD